MKRHVTLLLVFCFLTLTAQAQIADGSTAPDFTATDIDGNTYHLYELLQQGKTVYLDVFATWCGPCWSYHNSGALEQLWAEYGPNGTNEVFVFAIEGDGSTNVNCIYGSAGCNGSTQGNWAAGTPYPIINSASIASAYQINYFPTIFCICPADRKVYECGQLGTSGLINFRDAFCPAVAIETSVDHIQNVRCHGTNTGAVNISVSGGQAPYTYNWSNGAHTQDLTNVPAGTYTCSITSSNGLNTVAGPFVVPGPDAPLTLNLVETTPLGCNATPGNITLEASGGWSDTYVYQWQNGPQDNSITAWLPGNYTCIVTDANACTKSLTTNMAPPTSPTSSIAAPSALITCSQPTLSLNANASSQGDDFEYLWLASNGGHIASGATTLTPVVDAAGTYTLRVTNYLTTCTAASSVQVAANTTPPAANAGPSATLTCAQPTAQLQGSGSTGAGFLYLWSSNSSGNIVSGANTLTPTVNAAGVYTLRVTNTANGCTQTASASVTSNTTPPAVSATGGALTCVSNSVGLNAVTNAAYPVYTWTGPDNFSATVVNPAATVAGTYTVSVSDQATGCQATATATVDLNNTAPIAGIATPGNLNCHATQLQLNGAASSQGTGYAYVWTSTGGQIVSGETTLTPLIAQPGVYNLLVTNTNNGCTALATTSVQQSTPLVASINGVNPVSCFGGNDGSALANASGGAGALTYTWSNSAGTAAISGLTAGAYVVSVSDAENCTATASVTIAQPDLLTLSGTATAQSANGVDDGSAVATAAGGTAPYSYLWSNNATTPAISGLAPGNYTVVATDAHGCTAEQTVTINAFNCALSASISGVNVTCAGAANGSASVQLSGATEPVVYLWSNNAGTASIDNLSPGVYTVSVTDASNCPATLNITLSEPPPLSANATATPETASGSHNGSATANPTGGVGAYSYQWSNGGAQQTISDLAPGSYSVVVTDANGCQAVQSVVVNAFDCALSAQVSSVPVSCPGGADGSATAVPIGGSAPYQYVWNNGATTATLSDAAAGNYSVSITDNSACQTVQSVTIGTSDSQAPAIQLQSAQLSLGADGVVEVTLADLNAAISDNCTVTGVVIDPAVFDCDQLGEQEVNVHATDASGNSTTATVNITITDALAPVLTCPPAILRCADDNLVDYESPVVVDNCPGNGGVELTSGLVSGSEFPQGITVQSWSFVDAAGNVGTCTFDIVVTQPVEIAVQSVLHDHNGQGVGAIDIIPGGGTAPYTFTWTAADGEVFANTQNVAGLFAGKYTVRTTDSNGCWTEMTFELGNTVRTNEPEWLRDVRLRPNPTSGLTTVEFAGLPEQAVQLRVLDAVGKLVYTSEPARQTTFIFDASALPEGLYFVQFRSGQVSGIRKLVVGKE